MDEVIEKLAGGDYLCVSQDGAQGMILVMLARLLMTNMAIAEALSDMAPQDDMVVVEVDKAGWGGLDG